MSKIFGQAKKDGRLNSSQVTIPKALMNSLGWKIGDNISFIVTPDLNLKIINNSKFIKIINTDIDGDRE